MDFFNSLTPDLKMLAVAIAGFALLALFSGNQKNEKRYVLVLAVLAAIGVYRFNHVVRSQPAEPSIASRSDVHVVKTSPKHVPLTSTNAK